MIQPTTTPPEESDRIERLRSGEWLVTLRWSQEALAWAAYEMTFWYMGVLGQMLFRSEMPRQWLGMSPDEAGQNAAKMMLYYSILRGRSVRETSRAIALYNAYGFGYSLGANFVDKHGRRQELFGDDLREIAGLIRPDKDAPPGRSRTQPIQVRDKNGRVRRVIPAAFCRIRE